MQLTEVGGMPNPGGHPPRSNAAHAGTTSWISRPASTTATHDTSIGIVNECQMGTCVSLVEPVRSVSTDAICEPFAGNSQTPMSDGHIAVITPGASPAASAIGMSVFVVADWLVVR